MADSGRRGVQPGWRPAKCPVCVAFLPCPQIESVLGSERLCAHAPSMTGKSRDSRWRDVGGMGHAQIGVEVAGKGGKSDGNEGVRAAARRRKMGRRVRDHGNSRRESLIVPARVEADSIQLTTQVAKMHEELSLCLQRRGLGTGVYARARGSSESRSCQVQPGAVARGWSLVEESDRRRATEARRVRTRGAKGNMLRVK